MVSTGAITSKTEGLNVVAQRFLKRVTDAVREERIPGNKLLRQPSEDLFEKSSYMLSKEFWNDPENLANLALGEHRARITLGLYEDLERSSNPDILKGFDSYKSFRENSKVAIRQDGTLEAIMQEVPDGIDVVGCDEHGYWASMLHLDKSGNLRRFDIPDSCGRVTKIFIPASRLRPQKTVIDVACGTPYKKTEFFPDGTEAETIENVKYFYDSLGNKTKEHVLDGKWNGDDKTYKTYETVEMKTYEPNSDEPVRVTAKKPKDNN